MIYVFIILVSAGIAWTVYTLLEGPKPNPGSEAEQNQSMDELYAIKNNMWVCGRCETLNSNQNHFCAACGTEKKK